MPKSFFYKKQTEENKSSSRSSHSPTDLNSDFFEFESSINLKRIADYDKTGSIFLDKICERGKNILLQQLTKILQKLATETNEKLKQEVSQSIAKKTLEYCDFKEGLQQIGKNVENNSVTRTANDILTLAHTGIHSSKAASMLGINIK